MTCKVSLESLPTTAGIALSIINTVIGLLALCGNLIVFVIVYRNTKLRTRSNCLLISLATTDFLVGLVLEPIFVIQMLSSKLALNCDLNGTRRFLTATLTGASMGTIALISYDRYIHLSKTVNYNEHMKKTKVAALITMSWLLPFVCTFFKDIGKNELVYSGSIVAYSSIAVAIIVVSYVKIMQIIKAKKRTLKSMKNDMSDRQQEQRQEVRRIRGEERAAKAIATIMACFAIFIAPIAVYHGLSAIAKIQSMDVGDKSSLILFYAIAMTISKANSAVNPFIYYYRIPEFKETAKKVFESASIASK